MKSTLTKLLLMLAVISCYAQPKGKTVKIDSFKSKFVQARNIEVWLPADYSTNTKESYPVLYMQDGQSIFYPETAIHKVAWEADDSAAKLIASKRVKPFIIVAIWSSDQRYMEYFPEKAAANFTKTDKAIFDKTNETAKIKGTQLLGDEYLKFLTQELKPYIDKTYRTKADAANTAICGSAMGALISLYAVCEYPNVFGKAACMSTHWPLLADNTHSGPSEAFKKYLYEKLPPFQDHSIYFDLGTKTMDQYYGEHQKTVDNIMKSKGYTDKNWLTKKFDGAAHVEKAWQERFIHPLMFIFKNEPKTIVKTLPKVTAKPTVKKAAKKQ